MDELIRILAPAGAPIAWGALGAFLVKVFDAAIQWRVAETPEDRRAAQVLDEATAIRAELRDAESRLRRELFDQAAAHAEQVAELQAQIDVERGARRAAEASEAVLRSELDVVKAKLAAAEAEIDRLKGGAPRVP